MAADIHRPATADLARLREQGLRLNPPTTQPPLYLLVLALLDRIEKLERHEHYGVVEHGHDGSVT